jgi:plasmid maintenance system killer protein
MDIDFRTTKLRKACSSDKAMRAEWGDQMAKKLKRRLADLEAAVCLEDMRALPGRFHQLKGDRSGEFAAALSGQYRLIFRPDHDPVPTMKDGGVDWAQITALVVIDVGVDYH